MPCLETRAPPAAEAPLASSRPPRYQLTASRQQFNRLGLSMLHAPVQINFALRIAEMLYVVPETGGPFAHRIARVRRPIAPRRSSAPTPTPETALAGRPAQRH